LTRKPEARASGTLLREGGGDREGGELIEKPGTFPE
jgi:hypothetical protein